MGILLDPNKKFVSIDIYYIEEVKQHGNSVFHFIRSRDDMDHWRKKGYIPEQEQSNTVADINERPQMPSGPPAPQQAKPKADPNKIIKKLTTHWTKLTWKDQNAIISRSLKTVTLGEGRTANELDGVRYRDLKLKTCLKKWSLTDDAGQPIPVEPDIIDNLDPTVAQELLSSFEKVTEPTEDELKE